MVELTMEARLAYKEMISALEKESSEEVKQSDCALQTHQKKYCGLDVVIVPLQESEEAVPNYSEFSGSLIKICTFFSVHLYIFIFKVNSFYDSRGTTIQ